MTGRGLVALLVALVLSAGAAGWLLGRRPDAERERRIGALVVENRMLAAERSRAGAVADSALKRAAHSDSAARAALERADRVLRTPRPAPPPVTTPTDTTATVEVQRLTALVDTLTVTLEDTRSALAQQLEAGARLRDAVTSLTAQGQRDSLQIARLTTELQAVRPAPGLSLNVGGGWKRAALFVGAGFIAGAIVTR